MTAGGERGLGGRRRMEAEEGPRWGRGGGVGGSRRRGAIEGGRRRGRGRGRLQRSQRLSAQARFRGFAPCPVQAVASPLFW